MTDALLGNHEGRGKFMIQGEDKDSNPPFVAPASPALSTCAAEILHSQHHRLALDRHRESRSALMFEDWKNALLTLERDGETALAAVKGDLTAFLDGVKQHLIRDPEPVFAVLRSVKPILIVKNYALVTRFEDVQEVLARDQVFQVTYGQKMEVVTGGGNFFLGMQNSPEYERDTAHMRSAIRREDLPGVVAPLVAKMSEDLTAKCGGQIDVVELSRAVPVGLIGAYFGCPTDTGQDLANWATVIFQYLFADLDNDSTLAKAAGAPRRTCGPGWTASSQRARRNRI